MDENSKKLDWRYRIMDLGGYAVFGTEKHV